MSGTTRTRVLFAIPHFYRPAGTTARHGSESGRARVARRAALESVVFRIHELFGHRHFAAQHHLGAVAPVPNPFELDFDIVVCTTGESHLLNEMGCPPSMYTHERTSADPKFLGWECHRVLAERLGRYDYYCYLEDDIVIEDPFFFAKLALFNERFAGEPVGPLLQPQRYESSIAADRGRKQLVQRIYMDYELQAEAVYEGEPLIIEQLGISFTLEPTRHPHSGCFFLSEPQMRQVSRHPLFLDRETIWITPLDTAATLVVAKALRIYKPAGDSMPFLSVRHAHPVMIEQLYDDPSGVPSWRY